MTKIKRIVIVCLLFFLFFLVGYLSAVCFLRIEFLIDYDSGALRKKMVIWPLVVYDEILETTAFHDIRINLSEKHLTGKPIWKTVYKFSRNSKHSHDYFGGDIYHAISRIEGLLPYMDKKQSSYAKTRFLEILRDDGESKAIAFAEKFEGQFVKEYRPKE